MKLICGWCQIVMRDGSLPASHGLCPTCAEKLQAETDRVQAARLAQESSR